MTKIQLVADLLASEYLGGAEMVDDNIATYLGSRVIKSDILCYVDPSVHYILSNALNIKPEIRQQLINTKNYSIFEHDFKIHKSREPHYFKDYLFPVNERINLDLFENAKNVFVQSKDHLECYTQNTKDVNINFCNLSTSVWSKEELDLLESLVPSSYKTYKFAISDNPYPLKGRAQSEQFCKQAGIDYDLIPRAPKKQYYEMLSGYPALVSFPIRKESYCRLVVEARCLGMNVITARNYGAVIEPWFSKVGKELIDFLRVESIANVKKIKELCT